MGNGCCCGDAAAVAERRSVIYGAGGGVDGEDEQEFSQIHPQEHEEERALTFAVRTRMINALAGIGGGGGAAASGAAATAAADCISEADNSESGRSCANTIATYPASDAESLSVPPSPALSASANSTGRPWAWLVCHDRDAKYKGVVTVSGTRFSVGRCEKTTSHTIANTMLSKEHFVLHYIHNHWLTQAAEIEDVSSNGTSVRRAGSTTAVQLQKRQKFAIGHGDAICVQILTDERKKRHVEYEFFFRDQNGREEGAAGGPTAAIGGGGMQGSIHHTRIDKRVFARGGNAAVCRGMNELTGGQYAVKRVPNSPKGEHEITVLQRLNHTNVVQYISHGPSACGAYLNLLLGYADGGTIQSILRTYGALKEKTLGVFLYQITSALQYLHSSGVVHMDVKGANVLVTRDGKCLITDFGTATDLKANPSAPRRGPEGTPRWMAPEVARSAPHTEGADIWSLGCLVIEMATARYPWVELRLEDDCNGAAVVYFLAQLKSNTRSNRPLVDTDARIGASCHRFVEECFAFDPAARPSATALLTHEFLRFDPIRSEYYTGHGDDADMLAGFEGGPGTPYDSITASFHSIPLRSATSGTDITPPPSGHNTPYATHPDTPFIGPSGRRSPSISPSSLYTDDSLASGAAHRHCRNARTRSTDSFGL